MIVSDLKRGDLFMFTDSNPGEVYQFVTNELDNNDLYNCVISRALFLSNGEWHPCSSSEQDCNTEATVKKVKISVIDV